MHVVERGDGRLQPGLVGHSLPRHHQLERLAAVAHVGGEGERLPVPPHAVRVQQRPALLP